MLTRNQRIIKANFTGAQIVGDGAWLCLSDCGLFQIAYLFSDQIQRDTAMLCCGHTCRGKMHHTARQIRQSVVKQPSKPFRVPGDWEP
jgi:hypothetical protein